jgi:hypothetical protein
LSLDFLQRIEQAIAKANAQGMQLELGKPQPWYEDYEPHTSRPRRREVVRHLEGPDKGKLKHPGIPGVLSGEGRQTRSMVARGGKHEELGFAEAGLDQLPLAALCWCLNGEQPSRAILKHQLLLLALELRERDHWPKQVRRADCPVTGFVRCDHRYMQDLCTLALREGKDPWTYSTETNRARFFGISDKHWRRSGIANGYGTLMSQLASWFEQGISDLGRRVVARAPLQRRGG